MESQNPYINLYRSCFNNFRKQINRENLVNFAVNLGQVHNLLGNMISDIIWVMGTFSIQSKSQGYNNKSNQNTVQKSKSPSQYKISNKQQTKQIVKQKSENQKRVQRQKLGLKNMNKIQQNTAQKMQIQNHFQCYMNSGKIQNPTNNTGMSLQDYEFQNYKFPDLSQKSKNRNFIFSLLQSEEKKTVEDSHKNKQQKSILSQDYKSYEQSFPTIKQNLLSHNNQKKLAATNSFQQLTAYNNHKYEQKQVNKETKDPSWKGRVKQKNKKTKIPFFDLYDNSQTPSIPDLEQQKQVKYDNQNSKFLNQLESNLIQISSTQTNNNHKVYTQANNNDHQKINISKSASFSPQIQNIKHKRNNFLQQNQWVYQPSKPQMHEVEQVDQIQFSSQKKPQININNKYQNVNNHIKANYRTADLNINNFNQDVNIRNKSQNYQQRKSQSTVSLPSKPRSHDEYIPRRQQNGRKKSQRQHLKGSQCPDCRAFYQQINKGDNNFQILCQCTSRHKSSTTFMKKHQVKNYSQSFQLD